MQPHSDWDDLDFDLLSALDRLDADVSSVTGLPWWLTRTGHPGVEFQVDTVEDGAEAALDRYDDKSSDKKKRPGTHRYAVPVSMDGTPMEGGLAREALLTYAAEQAKREQEDAGDDVQVDRRPPPGGWNPQDYGDPVPSEG